MACTSHAAAHTSSTARGGELELGSTPHELVGDVSAVRDPSEDARWLQRALDTLAGHRLSDPVSLTILANLFPKTRSLQVQRAIAGILIRADYQLLAGIDLAKTLLTHRVKSPDGKDLIDVLIRRLQST